MKNKKMAEFAKKLYKVMTVGQWLCVLCTGLLILCVVLAVKHGNNESELSSVSIGSMLLQLNPDCIPERGILLNDLYTNMVYAAIIISFFFIVCAAIKDILKPMRDGLPFSEGVSKKVRKLAFAFLAGGALNSAFAMFATYAKAERYSHLILNMENVLSYSSQYEMDFSFLIVFAITLFLSYIFEYGEELQNESDTTL